MSERLELVVNGCRVRGAVGEDGRAMWSVADFMGALYSREGSNGCISKVGSVYLQRFRGTEGARSNVMREHSVMLRIPGSRGALSAAMDAAGLVALMGVMRFRSKKGEQGTILRRAHAAYTQLMSLQ